MSRNTTNTVFIDGVTINASTTKTFVEKFELKGAQIGGIQIDYYDGVGGTKDATISIYARINTNMFYAKVDEITVNAESNSSDAYIKTFSAPTEDIKIVCAMNNMTSFKLRCAKVIR